MTDTRFAVGAGIAYVTDHVLALGDGGFVDADAMALCATADWGEIVARADDHHLDAVVMHQVDHVRIAVRGDATVVITAENGDRRFVGTDAWVTEVVERPHHVMLATGRRPERGDAHYRTDGGAVPASLVSRRLGAPLEAPADPFESLFGHTVARSVETAAVRPAGPTSDRRAIGVLVFSTGERVVLDTDVVLGRNPGPDDADADPSPRLVKVAHPGVSRRHATIHLDRWDATIEDLGSVNGTTITLPGAAPSVLLPRTPSELPVGAFVQVGFDVSFSVEPAA